MSNILGPDQTRCSVGPDLDQNGLIRSAAVPKHAVIFVLKKMSAHYICCIYSSALQSRSYGSK